MDLSLEFAAFFSSDVAPIAREVMHGRIQFWLTNSVSHVAMGGFLAALRMFRTISRRSLVLALGLLISKEIFFDVWSSWLNWAVILDSLWDISCYMVGAVLMFGAIIRGPSS